MGTLIWKELRENFKWALLAMLVLGAAECYALYQTQDGQPAYYSYSGMDGITLCKTSFLTITCFGCAAAGLLLGLLQILPELKRDQWAALLHRPASRSVIFAGKAVAGLILYATAVVPPFLFCVWLVATPGHFGAPFVPAMVLPGTVDLCVGLVYYFAALALALQQGGWFGVRVFPLLAAVHVSFVALNETLFYVVLEGAAAMALALCLAAWGAIHSRDSVRQRPWLGRFAFMAVVFYGVCGLGDLTRSFFNTVAPAPGPKYMQYQLSDKGVPMQLAYTDNVLVSVLDVEGKPFTDPDYKRDRVRNHLKYLNRCSEYIGDSHGWHQPVYPRPYRQSYAYLWANQLYSYPRLEQWFYLKEQRVMVCYQPNEKKAITWLDGKGFQPISTRPESFPPGMEIHEISQDCCCFWDSNTARLAYLPKREMANLALPSPGPIYGMENAWANSNGTSVSVVGVALATEMAVYDDKGTLLARLPYHQNMDRWGQLEMGLNAAKDRFYVWYNPSAWIDNKTKEKMPSYLEEVDAQGRVLHSYTLPPLPKFPWPFTSANFIADRLQSPAFFFGMMAYQKIGAELGSKRLKNDWLWHFGEGRGFTRELSLYITALSILLAAATLFWARRVHFSWRRAWTWAALVLAFGLGGFITFRLAADWPRLVACPRCRKPRPIDGVTCPHCAEGWPEPERMGTEIIESQLVEASERAN